MSKYILGSLATLLAVKGKDALPQFVPPNLSKAEADPPPPKTPSPIQARVEPSIDPVVSVKDKPAQPPHPEIN